MMYANNLTYFSSFLILTLPTLKEKVGKNYEALAGPLRGELDEGQIEQIYKVLQEMPTIHIELSIKGPVANDGDLERKVKQPMERNTWMEVHAGLEYILMVDLYRLGRKNTQYIYSPKFPKPKDEGWFLTLGSVEAKELLALKRIGYRSNRSSHQLCFTAPQKVGRAIYTVYLLSDGYIGWDQQFNIQLEVTPPPQFSATADDFDDYDLIKQKYERIYE